MTKTHGNTHDGDKRGKATLKSELKKYLLEYMLVLQCIRETLAIAQYDQAQDCSNYECTNYELGLSKLCKGAANFQLFWIFFFNTTLFLFFSLSFCFFETICYLLLLFLIRPHDVKHSENLQSRLSSNGMLVSMERYLHDVVKRLWLWLSKDAERYAMWTRCQKKTRKRLTH
jgi:hypothetical protein